jgi:hypothetical protein
MAKKLGYNFLDVGFEPAKAVNGNVLVEVVEKTSTRKSKSGIVFGVAPGAERSPYFIVRDVSKEAKDKLNLKPGDVIGFASRDIVSWVEASGNRYAVAHCDDIGVIYVKTSTDPEEYVDTPDLDLTGASRGDD